MVRGLCTHSSGVGSLGEDGPKAPIVLGTNTRRPCSVAMSNMLWRPTKRKRLCISVYVLLQHEVKDIVSLAVLLDFLTLLTVPVMLTSLASDTLFSPTADSTAE